MLISFGTNAQIIKTLKEDSTFIAQAMGESFIKKSEIPDSLPEVKVYWAKKVIVAEQGPLTRCFAPFGGSLTYANLYIDMLKKYRAAIDTSVKIFSMIIPGQEAYYCPKEAQDWTANTSSYLKNLYSNYPKGIISVNVDDVLSKHTDEDIYLRTDHHYSPLGAYYCAQHFCKFANVDFKPLTKEFYNQYVIKDFVGTMYSFSSSLAVKNAPEDFVYYKPKNVNTTATYITYKRDRRKKVIGENPPKQMDFFADYPDGSPMAYCTFIGGDARQVNVKTSVNNSRKLLIIKDSYGNPLTSYLFYSFQEIIIIDYRYFYKNIVEFIKENQVTDLLITGCTALCLAPSTISKYLNLLTTSK